MKKNIIFLLSMLVLGAAHIACGMSEGMQKIPFLPYEKCIEWSDGVDITKTMHIIGFVDKKTGRVNFTQKDFQQIKNRDSKENKNNIIECLLASKNEQQKAAIHQNIQDVMDGKKNGYIVNFPQFFILEQGSVMRVYTTLTSQDVADYLGITKSTKTAMKKAKQAEKEAAKLQAQQKTALTNILANAHAYAMSYLKDAERQKTAAHMVIQKNQEISSQLA